MVTRVLQVDAERPDAALVHEAAAVIRGGGLVAFPTETVYGLGANALDPSAVARIFEAKGRPATDPLIVHIADAGQLAVLAAAVPPSARALAAAFWPGPLTLILPKRPVVPDSVTAGLGTVAVRVPAHAVALALLQAAGVPVAAPSANRFSRPSPTRAAHVLADLDGRVDVVIDGGPTSIGIESTIVDCSLDPPVLRRPGGVTLEQLSAHVPGLVLQARTASAEAPQPAPGQMLRHYAPRARVTLYEGLPDLVIARIGADARALAATGVRIGILGPEEDLLVLAPVLAAPAASGRIVTRAFGARRDPDRAARELFDAIRSLDAESPDVILAAGLDAAGVGAAIRDRLMRAAEGRVVRIQP